MTIGYINLSGTTFNFMTRIASSSVLVGNPVGFDSSY